MLISAVPNDSLILFPVRILVFKPNPPEFVHTACDYITGPWKNQHVFHFIDIYFVW